MLNNRNPRYKRSKLERRINRDVIYCVILLLFLCLFCAIGKPAVVFHFKHTCTGYYKAENKVKIILHFCFICLDHFLKKLRYHQTTVIFFRKMQANAMQKCVCVCYCDCFFQPVGYGCLTLRTVQWSYSSPLRVWSGTILTSRLLWSSLPISLYSR